MAAKKRKRAPLIPGSLDHIIGKISFNESHRIPSVWDKSTFMDGTEPRDEVKDSLVRISQRPIHWALKTITSPLSAGASTVFSVLGGKLAPSDFGRAFKQNLTERNRFSPVRLLRNSLRFTGGDDLLSQTIRGTQKTISRVRSAYRSINSLNDVLISLKGFVKMFLKIITVILHGIVTFLSAPLVLVITVILTILIGGTCVMVALVPSALSLKSDDIALNETYTFLTSLDASLNESLEAASYSGERFINGLITTEPFQISTDIDRFMRYLDVVYGDYAFKEVQPLLNEIYKRLYDFECTEENLYVSVRNLDEVIKTELSNDDYELLEAYEYFNSRGIVSPPFDHMYLSKRYGYRFEAGQKSFSPSCEYVTEDDTKVKAPFFGKVKRLSASSLEITDSEHDRSVILSGFSTLDAYDEQSVYAGQDLGTPNDKKITMQFIAKGVNLNPTFYLTSPVSKTLREVASLQVGSTSSRYNLQSTEGKNMALPENAAFIRWCSSAAGVNTEADYLSCEDGFEWYTSRGQITNAFGSDLIFLDTDEDRLVDQIGVVESISPETVTMILTSESGFVQREQVERGSPQICGYAR